jgi:hypothetical protein
VAGQKTKPSTAPSPEKAENVSENNVILQKLHEELTNFQETMEELYLLKRVAADLKSYRKMIRLKRYD